MTKQERIQKLKDKTDPNMTYDINEENDALQFSAEKVVSVPSNWKTDPLDLEESVEAILSDQITDENFPQLSIPREWQEVNLNDDFQKGGLTIEPPLSEDTDKIDKSLLKSTINSQSEKEITLTEAREKLDKQLKENRLNAGTDYTSPDYIDNIGKALEQVKLNKKYPSSVDAKESVRVLNECIELQLKKSQDYQNPKSKIQQADYYPSGLFTIQEIVHAKLLRMRSVMEAMRDNPDYEQNFESLEDSAKDAINYLSFFVSYCRGKMEGQEDVDKL